MMVERFDRLQSRYLTTGDYAALQQMSTQYPIETRTLIEDFLQLGEVNDPDINSRLLSFYQDTTLQNVLAEVQTQYADMTDINQSLNQAFQKLHRLIPSAAIPQRRRMSCSSGHVTGISATRRKMFSSQILRGGSTQ